MKKICGLLAALVLLAGLAACGGQRPTPTIRIGVALYLQEDTVIAIRARELHHLSVGE